MGNIVQRVMRSTSNYTVMDFGCLKIVVLCAGILLGSYYHEFFLGYTTLLGVVFVISFLWIMYRTFIKHLQ